MSQRQWGISAPAPRSKSLAAAERLVDPPFDDPLTLTGCFAIHALKASRRLALLGQPLDSTRVWTPVAGVDHIVAGWLAKLLFVDPLACEEAREVCIEIAIEAIVNRFSVEPAVAAEAVAFAREVGDETQRVPEYGQLLIHGFPELPADGRWPASCAVAVTEALDACATYARLSADTRPSPASATMPE